MRNLHIFAMTAVLALASLHGVAHSTSTTAGDEVPSLTTANFHQLESQRIRSTGRPTEQWRYEGLQAYIGGHYAEAADDFRKAAVYADKFSQHYLSLMYWHGVGMPKDPVMAYVWADIAAERGQSRLLAIREKMWDALDATQRARVIEIGAPYFERYGDAAAKPRAMGAMKLFEMKMTGSHAGYSDGRLQVMAPNDYTEVASRADLYGKDGPRKMREAYWDKMNRQIEPKITVGEISNVQAAPANPPGKPKP